MDAALAGAALLVSSPSPSWGLSAAGDGGGGALADAGEITGGVKLEAAAETDMDMEHSKFGGGSRCEARPGEKDQT